MVDGLPLLGIGLLIFLLYNLLTLLLLIQLSFKELLARKVLIPITLFYAFFVLRGIIGSVYLDDCPVPLIIHLIDSALSLVLIMFITYMYKREDCGLFRFYHAIGIALYLIYLILSLFAIGDFFSEPS